MSDSDDEFSDFLNCYTSTSVKSVFKKQIDFVKQSINFNPNSLLEKTCDIKKLVAETSSSNNVMEDYNSSFDVTPDPSLDLSQPSIRKLENKITKLKKKTKTERSFARDEIVPHETISVVDISQDDDIQVMDNTVSSRSRRCTRSQSKHFNPVEVISEIKAAPKKRPSRRSKKSNVIEVVDYLETKENKTYDDINYEMSVKVLWKSVNVIRFTIRRLQKLSEVFESLAKQENVSVDQILLTLNGKTLKQSDTPESLNLNVCDFLEGGVVNKKTDEVPVMKKVPSYFLNFQYENKKLIPLSAKRNEPLRKVMILFSEQIEKPLSSIKFFVDGERISCDETPESLDLDRGDIIDVTFSS